MDVYSVLKTTADVYRDRSLSPIVYRLCCQFCCQLRLIATFADLIEHECCAVKNICADYVRHDTHDEITYAVCRVCE